MKNKTIKNKNLNHVEIHKTKLQQHELLLINKLKYLYLQNNTNYSCFFDEMKKAKQDDVRKKSNISLLHNKKDEKWLNYFLYNHPINILFSIDQFLFELAKKQPQRKKSSEFNQQLKEKKKLLLFYGYLPKKQLKNIYNQAKSLQGYLAPNFFSLLERRLDVVIYRTGLVKNTITARQLISHKKILVNNKIVNSPSYQVNPGDIISIIPNKKNEIVSSTSELIKTKIRKRRSRFTISKNFLNKLQNITNFKNYKPKNSIENYIRLLLTKIDKRAYLKVKEFSRVFPQHKSIKLEMLINNNNFTVFKFKKLLLKQAKSFRLIYKKYLSLDRKPFFQNKAIRFLNFLERNGSTNIKLGLKSKNSFFFNNDKKDAKDKKVSVFINDSKSIKNKKQSNTLHSFTRKLSTFTSNKQIDFQKKNLVSKSEIWNKNEAFLKSNTLKKKSFKEQRIRALYRNIVYKTLLQMHSSFFYLNLKNKKLNRKNNRINTLLTLKLKKHITKRRHPKQILRALRICLLKPIHLEISYSISTAIFLYSPQRLCFPFYIDVDLISRFFR